MTLAVSSNGVSQLTPSILGMGRTLSNAVQTESAGFVPHDGCSWQGVPWLHQTQKEPLDWGGKLGSVHSQVSAQAAARKRWLPPGCCAQAAPGKGGAAGVGVVGVAMAHTHSAVARAKKRMCLRRSRAGGPAR